MIVQAKLWIFDYMQLTEAGRDAIEAEKDALQAERDVLQKWIQTIISHYDRMIYSKTSLKPDPPKSGQPHYSGRLTCPRLILP